MPKGRPPVERVTLSCGACGSEIVRRASDVRRLTTGRVFCNDACRKRAGGRPRRGTETPCEVCGVAVYSQPGERRRFCSIECHNCSQSTGRVWLVCPVCEKSFTLNPAQARRAPVVTCSRECDASRRTKNGVGREHNGRPVVRWSTGYLFIWEPDHPQAIRNGWVAEHRWVAEQRLGRFLRTDEHVHHINGKKWDNRPENLEVLGHGEHSSRTGRERQAEFVAMKAELEEYRRRFGPLT